MAEEQRMWSRRHVHESSTISHGQFGTPTYHQPSGDWEFLRKAGPARPDDGDSDIQHNNRGLLNIFTEAERLVEGARPDVQLQGGHPLSKNPTELAPSAPLINAMSKTRFASKYISQQGQLIALGSAVWLNSEGIDSGNLTVPVAAFVTGDTNNTLQLACLGRDRINYIPENDTARKLRVPNLVGDPRTSISGTESISQVLFSRQGSQGKGDTFLLVRRLTHTTIFEPLLNRDASVRSSTQEHSSLDLNPLVTLDTSVTGGHTHVDSMFHPLNHRVFAIVDEEGNWSTWKIGGRRSTTARVLYQARLGMSGKIFSWKNAKRPDGIGLFFDGWHKILWLSNNGNKIDRLLIANRRMIRVIDTAGEETCSIDARLDVGNGIYILDVQAGPLLNLCFILTTSRVLVFDLKQQEWKDPASNKGPFLMGAFQHFHDPADHSLRMTRITLGDKILVGLYSAVSESLNIRPLLLSRANNMLSMTISDIQWLNLPTTTLDSQVATIVLAHSEYVRIGGDPISPDERPVCVIVQCEDSSIHTFWAMATTSSHMDAPNAPPYLLKLPPNRSVHSQRYADDTIDEVDDIEKFITLDHERVTPWRRPQVIAQPKLAAAAVARNREMKRVSTLVDAIEQHRTLTLPQSTVDIFEMLQSLEAQFHSMNVSKAIFPQSITIGDLLRDDAKVQEIELLSDSIQQALNNHIQAPTSYAISVCNINSPQTLLSIYKSLFDTFVESLPARFPDRFRVRKERQDRRIALEQYLSSHTVHTVPREIEAGLGEGQEAADSSQMIFSDPIQDDMPQFQHTLAISASQPLPLTGNKSKKSDPEPSPLLDCISGLRTYAKINRDVAGTHLADSTVSEHVLSVLAHLPASCDEDPDEYDYQATMMSVAADKAESKGGGVQTTSRAQRKTARLARVRKRAEASTPAVSFLLSGANDKGVGNNSRDAESRNKEALPIRGVGGKLPGISSKADFGQSQNRHVFSDGHMPAEHSSQTAAYGGFTHTQPERGTFASRVEPNSQSKAKKKRRVAGF